jgi:hypothetical protein
MSITDDVKKIVEDWIKGKMPACDFCGEPADLTTTDCGGKEHSTCNSCLQAAFTGVQ